MNRHYILGIRAEYDNKVIRFIFMFSTGLLRLGTENKVYNVNNITTSLKGIRDGYYIYGERFFNLLRLGAENRLFNV